MSIDIDLQQYHAALQFADIDGKTCIFDPVRKKYIIAQPEELVRQLMIPYLVQACIYPISRIQVEKSINVNGVTKRFDLLVYDWDIKPFMIIEVKSFKVSINQSVADQAAIYNMRLGAPYLLVTNGTTSYCCDVSSKDGHIRFMDSVPSFPEKA